MVRTIQDYHQEILELFEEEQKRHELGCRQTPWAIGGFLRGRQMDVPVLVASQQQYTHGADPMAFLEEAEPKIHGKLEEEINALNGVKFQLAFKVQLRKNNPDGSAENTDPVLHHKQEAILQKSETKRALNQAFPRIIKQNARRGSGVSAATTSS